MTRRNRWTTFAVCVSGFALGCASESGMIEPSVMAITRTIWLPPVSLGSPVNLPTATDQHPALSRDGLSLYFASNRDPNGGTAVIDQNIWVSRWSCTDGPEPACAWGNPVMLGAAINSGLLDASPTLSRDEHQLFFASQRSNGHCTVSPPTIPQCDRDLWVSYREDVHNDSTAWEPAVNLGSPVNTNNEEVAPSYFENDDSGLPQLFFNDGTSNNAGVLTLGDIYISELGADGRWGARSPVSEVNTSTCSDQRPSISHDGLELYFHSTRPCPNGVPGVAHVWVSTRQRVGDAWSAPTLWPNPASNEPAIQPFIHSQGRTETLLFVRGGDIWMSQRTVGGSGSD